MRSWDGPATTLPLPHHGHDTLSGWLPTRPRDSPTIMVQFFVDRSAYASLCVNMPRFSTRGQNPGRSNTKPAISDTGAQLTVIPCSLLENLKTTPETIFPVQTKVNGASDVPILVQGGVLLTVTARNTITGAIRHTRQLCYVSNHVQVTYLSLSACIDLGTVPANFPAIGSCDSMSSAPTASVSTISTPTQCTNTGVPSSTETPCTCPRRAAPPTSRPQLSCAPTPENLPIMKKYVLERYRSSAFNCCERQPLNLM